MTYCNTVIVVVHISVHIIPCYRIHSQTLYYKILPYTSH